MQIQLLQLALLAKTLLALSKPVQGHGVCRSKEAIFVSSVVSRSRSSSASSLQGQKWSNGSSRGTD